MVLLTSRLGSQKYTKHSVVYPSSSTPYFRDHEFVDGTARCALTSPRALVVEEDPVDSEQVVGLSEVHHDPVGIELSSAWWISGREDRN